METLLYGISGLIAAFIGGMAPGAVNLNVVYSSIRKGEKATLPILFSASLGEVLLCFLAMSGGMFIERMINQNIYLQLIIGVVLILVGIYLVLTKPKENKIYKNKPNKGYVAGFLLAFLNPPVLVFWLLAFTYLATNAQVSPNMSDPSLRIIFFVGVLLGKYFILSVYLKLATRISKRVRNITKVLNKVIGLALFVLGLIQIIKNLPIA